jgi:hypothetical protein
MADQQKWQEWQKRQDHETTGTAAQQVCGMRDCLAAQHNTAMSTCPSADALPDKGAHGQAY